MRWMVIILSLAASGAAVANPADELSALKASYLKAGGAEKPFARLSCFLRKQGRARFLAKPVAGNERCDRRPLALKNRGTVALIDYTMTSDRPRLFLFDLQKKKVRALFVSHGRYGETKRSNDRLRMSPKANSILRAVHFSNALGQNASAGGFYLTGGEYPGKYGRSLVLHGLEKDVNDNACARAVVIHQNHLVNDRGTNIMSSGCPMVSNRNIDAVVEALKGGALIYMHSPREEAQAADACGRDLRFAPGALD